MKNWKRSTVIFLLYLLVSNPKNVRADDNFTTDANIEYKIQTDGETDVRSLKISRINKLEPVFISSDPVISGESNTSWDWIKVNSTHYLVRIKKNNPKIEMLVFSELFDSKWKIYKGRGQDWENAEIESEWRGKSRQYTLTKSISFPVKLNEVVSNNDHFLVNGFGNSWLIKESGEYYLDIIFTPQKTLEISDLISKSAFILIGGTVILLFSKQKKI